MSLSASIVQPNPQPSGAAAGRKGLEEFLHGENAGLDLHVLYRNWRTAERPTHLPLYDEVVLGRTGRAGNHTALVRALSDGTFVFAHAGPAFEEWIGEEAAGRDIEALKPDCAHVLLDGLQESLRQKQPVHLVAYPERSGYVRAYDIVIFPLSSRWGGPLLLAYARPRLEKYSLVDAIFASTTGGLMALAPVRGTEGVVDDFRLVALNQGAADLVRQSVDALRWQRLTDLFPHLSGTGAVDQLVEAWRTKSAVEFEFSYPSSLGGVRYFSMRASAMEDLVSASLIDVTEIRNREESFRLLFQDSPLPMFVYNPETMQMRDVNAVAVEHYGYSREQFLSMTLLDIRPDEERERVRQILAQPAIPSDTGDIWKHLKADGSIIEVRVYSRQVDYQGQPARLAVVVDVTEQRKTEARISFMAHHDALTALPNRVLFLDELRRTLRHVERHEQPAAILCIDLDYFKDVNDTLGHPVGDKLLQQVSERLRGTLRDNDLVARLGGDEFAVIQRDLAEPGEAGMLSDRLISVLSQPYDVDGQMVVIGASIGIAMAPTDGDSADALLKNADMALYRAKDEGRGTFRYFQPEMDARVKARRALEVELRRALVVGEFALHYQPFVSVETGKITGFEALLRWHHPERGMVPPIEFIPLAEDIGLIVPIGEWVLRQACRDAAEWPDDMRVAVNISAVQFKGQKLANLVASALTMSGISPGRLELEITELVLLHDSDANVAVLHQLRALGVRISMDDFGTGYSSLSYLRSFPFDKIKIDQSFVREIVDNSGDAAIVSAVVGMGVSLGISTTAEGVETLEQLERLRAEGCTEVQGYYLGRPMPAGEAQKLLARQV
ncbi:EAL domain-containing protein [Devosia riboflavina]